MFSVMHETYPGLSSALQSIIETHAKQIASGKLSDGFQGIDPSALPTLTPDIISKQFPDLAPSLYTLIQKTEDKMKKLN